MKRLAQQDEFSKRYLIKISSSIMVALINAVIQMLLPRVLEVEEYGIYSYNLNVFVSTVNLANLSCSSALISKFSKRNDEKGLLVFYLKFFLVISVILNIGMLILWKSGSLHRAFIGQTVFMVFLGLNAAVLTHLLQDVISMYDALALSRLPAIMQIAIKAVLGIGVCAAYLTGIFNLYIYYVIQGFITLTGIVILLVFLFKVHKTQYPDYKSKNTKQYCQEFYLFCRPLVLATCFAQFMTIIKNWILIYSFGEAEQAMYGVALQLNVLISYIFGPYAELMKREFAVIQNDFEQLQHRLFQSLQQVIWIVAYVSIFIIICTKGIVTTLFGDKYLEAIPVIRLIMFYTIFQAWGQIFGSFLIGTERTRLNAKFSYFYQVLGLICIIIFQVPNVFFPKGLGAEGIGWNYAVSNALYIGACVLYLHKKMQIRIKKVMSIQIGTMISCVVFAFLSKAIIEVTIGRWGGSEAGFIRLFLTGVLYTGGLVVFLWLNPSSIGLTREQLKDKLLKRGKK